MEYKAMKFEVILTKDPPYAWKWIVFLDLTKMQTGVALTRADAVLDAEIAIDKALEGGRCREGSFR